MDIIWFAPEDTCRSLFWQEDEIKHIHVTMNMGYFVLIQIGKVFPTRVMWSHPWVGTRPQAMKVFPEYREKLKPFLYQKF